MESTKHISDPIMVIIGIGTGDGSTVAREHDKYIYANRKKRQKTLDDNIKRMEEKGILRRAVKGGFPIDKPIAIAGKSLSETLIEGREDMY